ncbi:NCBP2 [Enterospora canceri]|uniref:Nuclear cap-binding protein subunit 2 n=1 Tax=Enterospora canceri TaxID=1081671 RepID=A0A1Y1S913_9MICR|nr:NCBP2 [Enterospora canceri]
MKTLQTKFEMDKFYKPLRVYVDKKYKGTKEEYSKELEESCTIYIQNIPLHVREERLWNIFKLVGEIDKVIMGVNKQHYFVGFAFIIFKSKEDATSALYYMNGIKIDGNQLALDRDIVFTEERRYGRGEGGDTMRTSMSKRRRNR